MTRVDENIHFPCASLLPLDLHFESLLMLSAGRASTTSKFIYVFNPKRSTFKIYNTVNSRSSWKTIRIGTLMGFAGARRKLFAVPGRKLLGKTVLRLSGEALPAPLHRPATLS